VAVVGSPGAVVSWRVSNASAYSTLFTALDAARGTVLWRRTVSYSSHTRPFKLAAATAEWVSFSRTPWPTAEEQGTVPLQTRPNPSTAPERADSPSARVPSRSAPALVYPRNVT